MKRSLKAVRKRDIQAVMDYEKRSGIRFNQMPSIRFVDTLPDELKLPVIDHLNHTPNEMRIVMFNPFDTQCPVLMDMPMELFDALEVFETDVAAYSRKEGNAMIPIEKKLRE